LAALGLALACSTGAAQCTTTPIANGQKLTGALESTCLSTQRPGSYARRYTFNANATDSINIAISGTDFDAFGVLFSPGGSAVAWDDNSGGSRNPLIKYTAAASGSYTVEVTSMVKTSGNFTIALTVTAVGAPVVAANGVVNGASYLPGIASGSWITIRGTNLSATTRTWNQDDFRGNYLPLSLDGISVKVNNKDAPVYFISPTQINALAPADTATGSVAVTVTNSRGPGAPVAATLQRFAPAWFAFTQAGGVYPAAVHADGAYLAPAGLFGAAATSLPAMPDETILLFGTGFGPTDPAADPLQVVSGGIPLAAPSDLTITVGGTTAKVSFAGMTGNGMYQFNIVVPNLPDGEHNLIARIGGMQTQPLRLAVRRPPPVPALTNMSPNSFLWGQSSTVTLTGTGLSGIDRVEFSDPGGLQVTGNLSSTTTSVSFRVSVAGETTPGDRTIAVAGPGGRSNAIPFTIRRGNPRLTVMSPTVVYPDRIYSASSLYSFSRDRFSLLGSDLAGVDQINFSPPEGFGLEWSSGTLINGNLFVAADTPVGPHQVSVSSPGGTSNSLNFSVQSPPPTAPIISSVTLQPPTLSGGRITYRGSLTFADSDGDINAGCTAGGTLWGTPKCSFIRMVALGTSLVVDATGSFLDLPGQSSGTIAMDFTVQAMLTIARSTTATRVAVTFYDTIGHPSNTVIVQVPSWIAPIF
jgi:uncharacterized protein (TIGR03437 family)